MTKWTTSRVNCPACCEDGNFEICSQIDITENPELKQKIFSRELFRFTCPECGEKIIVAYDCTLIDSKNKFIISLVTSESDEEAASKLKIDGYQLRITHSVNQFTEKLALFEDNTDDKVIELYKLMLEAQYEDERPGAEILGIYYGGKDDDNLLFYIITGDRENCRATLSMQTYRAIEEQFASAKDKYINDCEIDSDWAVAVLQSGELNKE